MSQAAYKDLGGGFQPAPSPMGLSQRWYPRPNSSASFARKSAEELLWNASLRSAHVATPLRGPFLPNNLSISLGQSGLVSGPLAQAAKTLQLLVASEKANCTSLPRAAIIIVKSNGKDDTLNCLATVTQLDYPNHEVVVVDNGSIDDSFNALTKHISDD